MEIQGEGTLGAEICYKVVYEVVQRELIKNEPTKGCENFYSWAKRIPHYEKCDIKLAKALCTSVSHSKNIGLECFFKSPLFLDELRKLCGKSFGVRERVKFELIKKIGNDSECIELGSFIRKYFNGNLTLSNEDLELLNTI